MVQLPCPLPVDTLEVSPLFHPILNARTGKIIGVEALARFPDYPDISPEEFFIRARAEEQALALDRRCREASVSTFCGIPHWPELLLFLNLDSVVFRPRTVGSGMLAALCGEYGLTPDRVVIEILENRAEDLSSLRNFVEHHRELGFLIAIDDIGSGYSNLNRITVIKPDIIKIDRGLVAGIDGSHHKKAIVGALTGLARRIGALTVGEGVETLEEASVLLELGIDLLQGYHYTKPVPMQDVVGTELVSFIDTRMEALRDHGRQAVSAHQWYLTQIKDITRAIAHSLESGLSDSAEEFLADAIEGNGTIRAAYILNLNGIQISDTVGSTAVRGRGGLFMPSVKGTDQSFKPYYLNLRYGAGLHITEPYISHADGEICRTCSIRFVSNGSGRILCVDFRMAEE